MIHKRIHFGAGKVSGATSYLKGFVPSRLIRKMQIDAPCEEFVACCKHITIKSETCAAFHYARKTIREQLSRGSEESPKLPTYKGIPIKCVKREPRGRL